MERTYVDDMERSLTTPSTGTGLKDRVSDAASQAKDKVEEVGRRFQNKIDENRGPAADRLQGAAERLHERADRLPGGQRVTGLAHSAADKMRATADYVRDHKVQDMMSDLETFVRKHPGESLIAAAAVGFLVGRTLRRRD